MEKAKEILKQLTLEEKASLFSGKNFWELKSIERVGLPSIMVTDGPHGLRKQGGSSDHLGINNSVPATCFPTAVGIAASWDKDLAHKVGSTIADECLQENVSVLLGPGANIKRSPICGRNFEYFSEDPLLSGEIAAAHINGVQSKDIGTSLKHYVANNQETRRMTIDTLVDERTLREIYLRGFEIAVKKAQPWTVMCSYNKINGTYAAENKYLLDDILKEEWGHTGIVVTDWGANNDRVPGVIAGQELEMPSSGGVNDKKIVEAVKNGELDEAILDKRCLRLIELILKSKATLDKGDSTFDANKHHNIAREVAADTMVLLKNDNILPLNKTDKVALIGDMVKNPRYQGAGSSKINPTQLDNAFDIWTSENIEFEYAKGYDSKTDKIDNTLIDEAVNVAKNVDKVILFVGLTDLYESEGFDRSHMYMPLNHNELIKKVSEVNKNVVVCLANGSPVEMPWLENVSAVLETYLGGQATAGATFDILYGNVNPSGKLAETFPIKLEDNSSDKYFPMGPAKVEYREGLYVGYRYFDKANVDVLYPFGYGLSYTTYEYSNLKTSSNKITDKDTVTVSVDVTNTGAVAGKEIVQVYVEDIESTIHRPLKELAGFDKVSLNPGETKTVSIELDKQAFAYYNVQLADWHVESGDFKILVGASSVDIKLDETIYVESTIDFDEAVNDLKDKLPNYYDVKENMEISKSEFEALYGKKIDDTVSTEFTKNSTLGDIKHTFIGGKLYNGVLKQMNEMFGGDEAQEDMANMMKAMIEELPLRGFAMLSGGKVSAEMVDGLVFMLNKRYLKGITHILKNMKK